MDAQPAMKYGSILAAWFLALAGLMSLVATHATADEAREDRRLMQLGPGDQISVQVYGQPDMSTTVYIGDDGTISVPLVGTIAVGGLSPVEAGRRFEQALKDGQFLVDPHVSVSVIQSRSQRVSVLGAIGKPGRYPIDPNTSIFDLLAEAGGVNPNSSDVIYIQRPQADGTTKRFPVELRNLGDRDNSKIVTLQAGDQVFVPVAEQFYIYGEVASPNKYTIEPGMTVIQAIARAGGVTTRGSARRVDIKRATKDHTFETRRAQPDEPVQPDDVIHVKESIF